MLSAHLSRWLRPLAVLALCLQVMLPTALAHAQSNGVDVSRYLCLTSGSQLSPEAQQTVQALVDFLDEAPEDAPPLDGYCAFCTLAQAAPLPASDIVPDAYGRFAPSRFNLFETDAIKAPRGPPVGLRAPPTPIR